MFYWSFTHSIYMNYLIAIITLSLLFFANYKLWKKTNPLLQKWFLPVLLLHVVAGIAVGLLYIYYYDRSDTWIYFKEGLKVNALINDSIITYLQFLWNSQGSETFLENLYYTDHRALFMVKITSLILILSADHYWLAAVVFSVISFWASWKICQTIHQYFPQHLHANVFSFLLLPSVVFWSSGIVKETIALAALFYLCHIFLQLYKQSTLRWHQWLMLILSLWLLYNLKYYYLAVAFPVMLTTYTIKNIPWRWIHQRFFFETIAWLLLFSLLSLGATQIHPNFHPDRFLSVLYNNYQDFIAFSDPEDVMRFSSLAESWKSVILLAPWAFISGLFRPFLWECHNSLQLLAALENTALALLFVSSLPALKKLSTHPDRQLILALLVFSFVLNVFLTLSTPNYGTLIRYRVGFLPFFVFLTASSSPIFKTIMKMALSRKRS